MEMSKKRELMLDSAGKMRTTSLFIETQYGDEAIFSYKDQDYVYKGRTIVSLKKLYLEMEDPTEYEFANKYLLSWRHWQRMVENKVIRMHINEWRDELEYKLRSKAVRKMMKSAEEGNYQASKWFADRGWASRAAGRPSKAEIESEKKIQANLDNEFNADVHRLFPKQG